MSHASELIATDIEAYLAEHERKDLLRLLTCGSVDDGKSTLIGRLLHDSRMIYEDQLAGLEVDSTTMGSAGDHLDLALLMDGLKAEREQGITIDVAYRYFSTARRKFIVADTPGHEQYTRNMATGASTCELAVILVDARHGVLDQTRRHSHIASLLGIQNVVVAVNKMDLVAWSEDRFDEIRAGYQAFATGLGLIDPYFLPMSALLGDNVVKRGDNLTWFDGPPLMEYLETVDVAAGLVRHHSEITPEERVARFGQRPCTVLLTGLTAAGKSTIAAGLERRLFERGHAAIRLDGENVRLGISRDLGFSARDRSENLRRVAEVALLANRQGLIAIAALVAPEADVRVRARELIGDHRFVEVFVDTPIEVCRQRDPSGQYEAADRGEIEDYPGVSSTYDQPTDMDLRLDTSVQDIDECVDAIFTLLEDRGVFRG